MGQLRTCVVSYYDMNFKHHIEITAETLFEAAVLGIKAMNVPQDKLHLLHFDVLVKAPEVYHSISGPSLSAWLARKGKNQEERALKARLAEILRG